MDLKGRGAIVTGSATGIGAAVAKKLAARGAKVAINYSKSEADAKATLAEIKKDGGEAVLAQGDVALDGDCRRMAETVLKAFGRIDILVNNAGTTKFADHANLEALTAEDFHSIYAVNVIGPYQMIRAVLPHMKQRGYGAVVNVSSIAGVSGIGSSIAYAASKGALNTMTLSLSRALAPEIRVNAVCPGFVGTRWFRDRFGEEGYSRIVENQKASTPLRRAGTPDDIADAVVFFCAEGAEHITGETLLVDAGLHLSLTPLAQR
jgi:3-oxoacyl-[acyl-carrier protein] reductase